MSQGDIYILAIIPPPLWMGGGTFDYLKKGRILREESGKWKKKREKESKKEIGVIESENILISFLLWQQKVC